MAASDPGTVAQRTLLQWSRYLCAGVIIFVRPHKKIVNCRTQLWITRNFLPTTEGGIRMSAIAMSTLFVVVILTAMLLAWWRTILKVLAVTVLVLTSIGMAEVVATLVSGFTPN
jgi:hypothetical protein